MARGQPPRTKSDPGVGTCTGRSPGFSCLRPYAAATDGQNALIFEFGLVPWRWQATMPISRMNRGLRFAQTGQFFVITGHKDAANEEKTRRNGEEDARTTRRNCGLGRSGRRSKQRTEPEAL
jgi:hypothetical protein